MDRFESLPQPSSCRLIDFETSTVRPGIVPGTFFLTVTGQKPCLNMRVELIPLVYIAQPDYWSIEVVGCLPGGICLTAMAPYTVSIPLHGITGKKGIEVVGATRRQRHDVP
jgi:hypothetical protein